MALDRAGFEDLYAAHASRLFSISSRITGNPATAEDIVQEAFIKAYTTAEAIADPGAWLATVTRNASLNTIRSSGRTMRLAEEADEDELAAPELPDLDRTSDPSVAATLADSVSTVWGLVEGLRPETRAAMVLRYGEDLPIERVSSALGKTVNATTVLLHRGRAALRSAFADQIFSRAGLPEECRARKSELVAFVGDRTTASAELLAHLEACTWCPVLVDELRSMSRALGVVPPIALPVGLLTRTRTALDTTLTGAASGGGTASAAATTSGSLGAAAPGAAVGVAGAAAISAIGLKGLLAMAIAICVVASAAALLLNGRLLGAAPSPTATLQAAPAAVASDASVPTPVEASAAPPEVVGCWVADGYDWNNPDRHYQETADISGVPLDPLRVPAGRHVVDLEQVGRLVVPQDWECELGVFTIDMGTTLRLTSPDGREAITVAGNLLGTHTGSEERSMAMVIGCPWVPLAAVDVGGRCGEIPAGYTVDAISPGALLAASGPPVVDWPRLEEFAFSGSKVVRYRGPSALVPSGGVALGLVMFNGRDAMELRCDVASEHADYCGFIDSLPTSAPSSTEVAVRWVADPTFGDEYPCVPPSPDFWPYCVALTFEVAGVTPRGTVTATFVPSGSDDAVTRTFLADSNGHVAAVLSDILSASSDCPSAVPSGSFRVVDVLTAKAASYGFECNYVDDVTGNP